LSLSFIREGFRYATSQVAGGSAFFVRPLFMLNVIFAIGAGGGGGKGLDMPAWFDDIVFPLAFIFVVYYLFYRKKGEDENNDNDKPDD
jgi:membrane protease YdiL (CAAX protease family)